MENLNAEQIKKALENWAKNFEGKATEFVILCSAIRIIDYLSKENERLNETCEKLADTIENIEDHCKTYMKDYFKSKGKSEAEVRADTVRKMRSKLYGEFLKVAKCQVSDEPNMRSREVFLILDQTTKEMIGEIK